MGSSRDALRKETGIPSQVLGSVIVPDSPPTDRDICPWTEQ